MEDAADRRTVSGEIDTGVPGLAVARSAAGDSWRLVHRSSGLLLSRAAVSVDPTPLVRLAERLALLADWTKSEIPVSGPVLRKAIEDAAVTVGLPLASVAPTPPGGHWLSEQERDLVLRVLRRIHTAVPPGVLASATSDLDPQERAHLRDLLTAQDERSAAVVRPLPTRQEPPASGAARSRDRDSERSAPPGWALPSG